MPKRSGARSAMRTPTNAERREQAETRMQPMKPELLADDREDEVGVRRGQEAPLRPALAQPDAGQAAAAERDERLRDLVAGVRLVVARVRNVSRRAPAGDRERESTPVPTAAPPIAARWRARMPPTIEQRAEDHGEHDRRREVGLLHDQRGEHEEDRRSPGATSALRQSPTSAPRAVSTSAAHTSSASFAISLGWTLPGPEADPAARAVDPDADAGNEHDRRAGTVVDARNGTVNRRQGR